MRVARRLARLPRLTRAIVAALAPAASGRRAREDEAIRASAERVCARPEPHLDECLAREFMWFFLGEGPPDPKRETNAQVFA